MAKKNNIGLGLVALAVGAGAVAAATKGHKAEVKKEERKDERQTNRSSTGKREAAPRKKPAAGLVVRR